MTSVNISVNGMNNRAAAYALPKDKLRNAVNVTFDNANNVLFPRPGKTVRYTGNCHSIYQGKDVTLFVEDGALKKLNEDNTADTLYASLGDSTVYYTSVGDTTYFANGIYFGKVRNGVASPGSTARPPRQPDCYPTSTGDLFAGDYRVAVTWIADEESGTGMGRRVTVQDGGGIRVTNLPTPPSHVESYAVYVSSVNGKEMYLYGEYPVETPEVYIGRLTSEGLLPTVPLTTQFGFPPIPKGKIIAHLGRIYYPRGDKVYWTQSHRYGLQKANSYWTFDSEVQVVVSTPPTLYVGTEKRIYRITNIDSDDGIPPQLDMLQTCASTGGSETSDPFGTIAYWMTDRGFIKATADALEELTYEQVAMPSFKNGAMTVTEVNGVKYLIGCFRDGTQNLLVNKEVNASELARGSL